MKIYVLTSKSNPDYGTVLRMTDFLVQRGHEVSGINNGSEPVTYTFEHQIELLKACDWLICNAIDSGYNEGFLTALATNKFQKKTLFVYKSELKTAVPELVLGCTYPNSHIKSYKTWNDLQDILTLFKF